MPAKSEQPAPSVWSVPVSVVELSDAGLHREIEADAEVRARVAVAAEVREVLRLVARFDIVPMSGRRVHVAGHVSARVGQNCVVTLEPLESEIEENIDVVFSTDAAEASGKSQKPAELDIPALGQDPPEPLVNGRIDLGALAIEFLILGINPYPRKSDVVFEPPAVPEDSQKHPFSALEALKDKPLKS
jgi:uncharacterized metal-binding protein YceD (DUF177 family)